MALQCVAARLWLGRAQLHARHLGSSTVRFLQDDAHCGSRLYRHVIRDWKSPQATCSLPTPGFLKELKADRCGVLRTVKTGLVFDIKKICSA